MDFREFLQTQNKIILDGGTGTMLEKLGLDGGRYPERLNVSHKDGVTALHRAYFDAGSNVVVTNTFGANPFKYDEKELEDIIASAVKNAKNASKQSVNKGEKFVSLDIGPLGRMLSPLGDLDFEDAVKAFSIVAKLGEKAGADLVTVETMNDLYETKAAVLGVKEATSLPVIVTNAYSENGRLMTGASPLAVITTLEGLGVDAIGVNCSFGPDGLESIVNEYLKYSSLPVIMKPNAGLPTLKDGKTVYDITPSQFAKKVANSVKNGVKLFGGCCGTTPEYIQRLCKVTENITPKERKITRGVYITSSLDALELDLNKPLIIGERINPTGKKRLKQAITEKDFDYILNEGINEEKNGADILDVNVGVPQTDEGENLKRAVNELQTVTSCPLCIDTSDPVALEKAMRVYNGKPLINSVNGKIENIKAVMPIVKKYGGALVCLPLDENGIPQTCVDRLKIARKIKCYADGYGIKDLIFDGLTMPISAGKDNAKTTLETVNALNKDGFLTVLGVSNVSFGLPSRDNVTASFLSQAINNGLSLAIINPMAENVKNAFYSSVALCGKDENCQKYIENNTLPEEKKEESAEMSLCDLIKKGLKDGIKELTKSLLETKEPTEIINGEIIPALNSVGEDYEKGKAFLPNLLICAECAGISFDVIKSGVKKSESKGGKVVLATVEGDIHDIGKNIVKLLLESYGFEVCDLGKDVEPEKVIGAIKETGARVCGLSALMTTTLPSMEKTVALIKSECPDCKTVVGGAVLTEEYSKSIGADFYAPDAVDTVRFAQKIYDKEEK